MLQQQQQNKTNKKRRKKRKKTLPALAILCINLILDFHSSFSTALWKMNLQNRI
jgi:hypothetical protein